MKIKPEKKLLEILKKHSGRDINGHISVRHQGGGTRRRYRLLTQLNNTLDRPCKVESIEYDPNRTAYIAKIKFEDKSLGYILAPDNLKVGSQLIGSEKAEIKIGNRMKLKNIPTGTQIYDIQLSLEKPGQLVKSAGSFATIIAYEDKYVHVKLPSGAVRRVLNNCFASIGKVSNPKHSLERISKAGAMRHKGIRPTVRGKVMSPRAHPHGGGEGVNPIGLKYPKTPWGKPARGVKTRKKKFTDKFIISGRKK